MEQFQAITEPHFNALSSILSPFKNEIKRMLLYSLTHVISGKISFGYAHVVTKAMNLLLFHHFLLELRIFLLLPCTE
jgi:hypothetical protein